MFCTSCGTRVGDGMLFCPNCGTKIVRRNVDPPQEVIATPTPAPEVTAQEQVKEEVNKAEEAVAATEETVAAKAEEVAQPVAEPEAPVAEPEAPVAQPAEQPAAQPEAPVEQPAAEPEAPVAQPEAPVAQPAEQPAAQPEAPVAQPEAPAAQPAAQPEAPAAQPVAQPEAKPKKEKKKGGEKRTKNGLHKKPSGGKVFGSILLCILLFIALIAGGLLLSVRLSLSEKQVRGTIEGMEVREVTVPNLKNLKEESSIVELLEEASGFDFEKSAGIKNKELEKFLDKPYVKETLADYVVSYVQYFMGGSEPKELSDDDVVEFIQKHNDDIEKMTGFSFCYQNPMTGKEEVYRVDIDNAFDDLGTDEIDIRFIERKAGISFGPIKLVLSIFTMIAAYAIAFVLIVLLFVIHGKTPYSGFGFVGMTILLAGAATDVAAGVGFILLGKIGGTLVSMFAKPLLIDLLIVGSAEFVAGLLLFLFGRLICNAVAKAKQKKAA